MDMGNDIKFGISMDSRSIPFNDPVIERVSSDEFGTATPVEITNEMDARLPVRGQINATVLGVEIESGFETGFIAAKGPLKNVNLRPYVGGSLSGGLRPSNETFTAEPFGGESEQFTIKHQRFAGSARAMLGADLQLDLPFIYVGGGLLADGTYATARHSAAVTYDASHDLNGEFLQREQTLSFTQAGNNAGVSLGARAIIGVPVSNGWAVEGYYSVMSAPLFGEGSQAQHGALRLAREFN